MPTTPSLRDEASGVATLLAVGLVAAVLGALVGPVVPHVDGAWVFVALVVLVLAWPRYVEGPTTGGDGATEPRGPPAGARIADAADDVPQDVAGEPADDESGSVGPLDIELVNWANGLVGTTCARCEEEISYANLRATDARSNHRLACGCTVVEAASLE